MNPDSNQGLIYGANGYTGRLIATRAVADGLEPILAGRNGPRIEALAKELGCPFRIFSLDHAETVARNLDGVTAVLHCAGPFSETAKAMMEACLGAGVHYLDITGEWKVIELAAHQHERAEAAGMVMMPAVGFDVVPSDCLAAQLVAAIPAARSLELAFSAFPDEASVSPGTAATVFTQLGQGAYVRKDGRVERVSEDWQTTEIPFSVGKRSAVTISWGDIASAFYTTGIPNIQVLNVMPRRQIRFLRRWGWLLPLTRWSPIQWLGRRWIKRNILGPSQNERASGHVEFWGRVTDAQGQTAEAILTTPEGYSLTTLTSLEILKRVLAGEVQPGFSTPAQAFGGKFIEQFAGVKIDWQTEAQ
jgi:short subunit dehydrogenase-like uncharacterized protein